jgi:hypothetical protein
VTLNGALQVYLLLAAEQPGNPILSTNLWELYLGARGSSGSPGSTYKSLSMRITLQMGWRIAVVSRFLILPNLSANNVFWYVVGVAATSEHHSRNGALIFGTISFPSSGRLNAGSQSGAAWDAFSLKVEYFR